MKFLQLNKNKQAIVDDKDYNSVKQYRWYCSNENYVITVQRIGNKRTYLRLHRIIMNPPDKMIVDHINHNPLDNRRCNLRIVSQKENQQNRRKLLNTHSSKFKGVTFIDRKKYNKKDTWTTRIKFNNKIITIGYFPTELSAAMAYDLWAKELYGQYANLNFNQI